VTDPKQTIEASDSARLLQVGKRKFARFVLKKE
jgi:hypothetical protein